MAGVFGFGVVSAALAVVRAFTAGVSGELVGPAARFLVATPDLLAQPRLRALWVAGSAGFAVVAVLPVALSGLAVATGSGARWAVSARSVVPGRLVGCTATALLSLPLAAALSSLGSGLAGALLGSAPAGSWRALLAPDPGAQAGQVLLAAGAALLAVSVAVQAVLRWALLWLLVALAPVVMAGSLAPAGEQLARTWWRLLLVACLLPVANAAALATAAALAPDGVGGVLAALAVLVLLHRLPGWALAQASAPAAALGVRPATATAARFALPYARRVR